MHAAGVVDLGPVADLDLDDWQRQLAVNLIAAAAADPGRPARAARRARDRGASSTPAPAWPPSPQWSAYAASKFGLRALADALRAEEAEHGVRVTSVFPGRTATPMQEKVHEQEGKEYDAAAWSRARDRRRRRSCTCSTCPRDSVIPDVMLRPRPA